MISESRRARHHRTIDEQARLEVKRQEYLNLISEGDPSIRASLEHLSLGALICVRHASRQRELPFTK